MKEEGPGYYNADIPKDLTLNPYWRKMYDMVASLLPSSAAIADLGCGPGHMARILHAKKYKTYWGIDFAGVLVGIAKKAVPEFTFTVGSLYDKRVQKEFIKYDAFVILEVLEHLIQDIAILNAIPVGKLVILSVPNAGGRGHVRKFKTVKDVIRRYRTVVAFDKVIKIPRQKSSCFWLGYGVRK